MILSFEVAPGFLAACEQLRLWQCSEALCFALLVLFAAITGFSLFAGRKAEVSGDYVHYVHDAQVCSITV